MLQRGSAKPPFAALAKQGGRQMAAVRDSRSRLAVGRSLPLSLSALGRTVTWVNSQWKSGDYPGQFWVEINIQENQFFKVALTGSPSLTSS